MWETQADFDVFMVDRLMPILRETAGSVSTPPQVTIYELHNYQASRSPTTLAACGPRAARRGAR